MTKTKSDWVVHINGGFVHEVSAENMEAALFQALAKFHEHDPNDSSMVYDIRLVNKTKFDHAVHFFKPMETIPAE